MAGMQLVLRLSAAGDVEVFKHDQVTFVLRAGADQPAIAGHGDDFCKVVYFEVVGFTD